MSIEYLSPDGLHKNPAFSQVVVKRGKVLTVYFGGRNAVNSSQPALTMLFVVGLANPDFLLEIEAIAVIPDNNG